MTALTEERLVEEVLHFPTNCPDCNAPAETNMKMTREFVRRSVSYCAAVHLVKYVGVEVDFYTRLLGECSEGELCDCAV